MAILLLLALKSVELCRRWKKQLKANNVIVSFLPKICQNIFLRRAEQYFESLLVLTN